MGHKRYWTAVTAAGMIGAMALGSAFTSYAAGSWTKSNDNWTYVDNGQVYTGWLQTSEGWYYMDPSTGYMTKDFKQIDGKWYYFSQEQGSGYGQLLTGTTTPDGYTVNENGEWVQ